MSPQIEPSGHVQVKPDYDGQGRSYWAFWRDSTNTRHGHRLGPAHVKDSGRRTARRAIIWRAGDGPKPTPEHVTPKEAAARLKTILDDARHERRLRSEYTLRRLAEGWVAERQSERGLKRSTGSIYADIFERFYRDLGEDTAPADFDPERLRTYFATFEAQRTVGTKRASELRAAGELIRDVEFTRWVAMPAESRPIEVATKAEAARVAAEVNGKWKHEAPRTYRITPPGAERARRVRRDQAAELESQGWVVERRSTIRQVICTPAKPQTRNKYRDLLSAIFDYGKRVGAVETNPMVDVPRAGMKAVRAGVLRRDDFYDRDEIDRLLANAPSGFEEAFWLCGFHAGARLPGEGLGLHWGAIDFDSGVIRIYDNWVENALDTTKTDDSAAVPMTPRLRAALARLKTREFRTADDDFVFTRNELGQPASDSTLRAAFKDAQQAAGLKPIPMYNARHSFGTALARAGVDVRTVQALMRHDRLSTTEQYMAYSPQPELAQRIAEALEVSPTLITGSKPPSGRAPTVAALVQALQDELPPKWLREVERVADELAASARLTIAA